MAIQIGCGSWADAEYVKLLYPGLAANQRLSGYAMWFDRVEVNASYYATPRREAVARWVEETPPDFLFDIRLHRAFSQSPEKSARESPLLGYLMDGLQPLLAAGKLGTLLLVLPPIFKPERHRLAELDGLIEKVRPHHLSVELRHADWVSQENLASTLGFFRERGLTWVAVDMPRIKDSHLMPPVDEVTSPKLAYLRLHGRNPNYLEAESAAEGHTYFYTDAELEEIAGRIRRLADKAENVRVVANNHVRDYAPRTALALQHLLKQWG